jgi:hypothetical protein
MRLDLTFLSHPTQMRIVKKNPSRKATRLFPNVGIASSVVTSLDAKILGHSIIHKTQAFYIVDIQLHCANINPKQLFHHPKIDTFEHTHRA